MSKSIVLKRRIKATPEEVYRALTNPFTIELWSGDPAVMSEEPGSSFTMMDGNIVGENVAFEPNKSIRQKWYFGEDHPSDVLIELFPDKRNTLVKVQHKDIPEEAYDNMVEGWNDAYLDSLKDFFEK